MDCPKIVIDKISKLYGETEILRESSLTVEPKTSVAFVSPSGSGKSTLLSMLGLILSPSSGDVFIGDKSTRGLNDDERSELRSKSIGFIFQHTQLIGSLRAWENVAVPAHFSKEDIKDKKQRACDLLKRFGLEERINYYPFQLSIGQKRRIACARALMLNPPILIADEPTNDLDKDSANSVSAALFEHVENGGILLYATHDEQLSTKADRVFHLVNKQFVER